jgi:RNA polymerase sigma-70 factor (ECF subfamily)
VEVKPQTTIDNELITEAQKGNQKAIAALMQKYQKSVYHLILRIVKNSEDAEKLVHESFARAFANMSQYSSQFSYSTWLFKIASNTSIDFLRRKRIEELAA